MFHELKLGGPKALKGGEIPANAEVSGAPPAPEVSLRALQRVAPAAAPHPVAKHARAKKAPAGRIWRVVLLGVLIVAAAGVAASFFINRNWPEAVLLQAAERDGVLQIEWEGGSGPVIRANRGTLEVIENGAARKYELSAAELRKGAFATIRRTDHLTIKLTLQNPAGGVRQEISHYLGSPIPANVNPLVAEIEALKAQNQSLRSEVQKERARANELQSWADVLEASLKRREGR